MKKGALLLLLFAGGVETIRAQQYPQYTQYVLNNYILNPAVAGIENYWDAKLSYRRQWIGIEGAPTTTYFSIHGRLGNNPPTKETATTVPPPGKNPYPRQRKNTRPHHGVGFTFINDKAGLFNLFMMNVTYAYHLPINSKVNLSMGVSAGLQNMVLNTSQLYFGETQEDDPSVIVAGAVNRYNPDLSVGLWLYSTKGYLGVSMRNLVALPLNYSNGKTEPGKLVQHLFITAGRKFRLSEDLTCIPSVLVKVLYPALINFDINTKFQYRDRFWVGTSYRHKDAVAFMAGVNINSTFNFGYSYDYTTSGLNSVSRGTHEIILGFLIGNRYKVLCPRFY